MIGKSMKEGGVPLQLERPGGRGSPHHPNGGEEGGYHPGPESAGPIRLSLVFHANRRLGMYSGRGVFSFILRDTGGGIPSSPEWGGRGGYPPGSRAGHAQHSQPESSPVLIFPGAWWRYLVPPLDAPFLFGPIHWWIQGIFTIYSTSYRLSYPPSWIIFLSQSPLSFRITGLASL